MRLMPRTRRGSLWRFFFAAVLVIGATAGTTAVAGLLQFKQLAADLSVNPSIRGANVTPPNPGQPQTILIIGSDHRAGAPFNAANTDTMLLVRLNGSSSTINVISVPRDLEVNVPGEGTAKLNSAYSVGGPNLLVKVLKQQVFPGLKVNHIVDVNFGGFQALVNAIGCVYTDVDHRYYNNTALTGYSSIDIQPGYQKLCGVQALQFVRFRHSDSDIVRNARQQDFIRWAKDQYGLANLLANKDRLLKIFGAHTETDHDLHTTDGLINLFNLVAFSAGHTIKAVKFPAILQPCPVTAAGQTPCYVTAEAAAEAGAFRAFMRPTQGTSTVRRSSAAGHSRRRSNRISTAGLTADVSDGKSQAAALGRARMPVYYPRLILAGSNYCSSLTSVCPLETASPGSYPRAYAIRDQHGKRHTAYRMTLELNPVLGEYYGVQGTTWQDPPIFGSPTETRMVAGRRLLLYAQGGKVTNVAWHTPSGIYWISNTLTNDIGKGEMVAIAASLTR
jgi:polyisoprenyl-teichoic acid--peptidoglycan teichoic acid transferase